MLTDGRVNYPAACNFTENEKILISRTRDSFEKEEPVRECSAAASLSQNVGSRGGVLV